MTSSYNLLFFILACLILQNAASPSNATNPNATVLNGSNGSNAAPNGSNGSNANSNHIALSLCFVNLNTINLCNNQYMYDAVTWYSGNLCGDSFLPGGKIADFFGYQYLRDTAPNQADHTTEFVTYSSKAFLSVLSPGQTAIITAYAANYSQYQNMTNQYVNMRFPIYKAFRRLLNGDLPSGTSGLNQAALLNLSQSLYEVDAVIAVMKAQAFATIINSLDSYQKSILEQYVKGGFNSWPVNKTNCDANVMGLASEMFGWYAGNLTSDTYFAPERINDYFGSFYFKDGPDYGTSNYSVATHVTGTEGDDFYSYLNLTEQSWYDAIMPDQFTYLTNIVEVRSQISTELRKALSNQSINTTLVN